MDRDDILAAFSEKAVLLLVEKGKDDLLQTISNHLETREETIPLQYQLPLVLKRLQITTKEEAYASSIDKIQ